MESRSKYSEEADKNLHNELYKESGVCNTESENLCSNLPRNKPEYGEKAFTYLEGDALSTVLNKACALQNKLHLNSNSVDSETVGSEKLIRKSVLNSTNNFFRDDSGYNKESNNVSEIKTLNISFPITPQSTCNFQDAGMRNSYRMPNAVRVLPRHDSDPRNYIQKSRSLNENDNIRHITKGVPQLLHSSTGLPRSTSAPVLPPRNTNKNTQNCFTEPVLHCDAISETDPFKHHIYEEIDDVRPSVISLTDTKASVHATNQSQLEHPSTSVLDIPEEVVGSSQLNTRLKVTEENVGTNCVITSRNRKLTNISPNPAFQAEIASKVQKRFREEMAKTKIPLTPNSDLNNSLVIKKPAISRDGVRHLENASVRKMIDTFEEAILPVNNGENTRNIPAFTHEAINDGNIAECTRINHQEMNITEENINKFEKSKFRYNENKEFFEKVEDPNMLQQSESCQGNLMRRANENQMIESNERLGNAENRRHLDEAWMNYTNRPLLPIKSIHKQKSLSCTNLFQTFKGFSKRNSSDNTKLLLVETTEKTAEQRKENCTSEENTSKDDKAKDFLAGMQPLHENNGVESPETKNYAWFHQVNAREATKKLLSLEQDGAFLVRPASNPSKKTRYTLCVSYANIVYNMHIRDLENGHIALGEKKEKEKTFSSLLEMIRYHQDVPIRISIVQSGQVAKIYLLITPPK